MVKSSRKWKKFERLVAAIHQAADEGAKVRWNERIRGRQFDVTVRFRKGFYEYLTVIECKDHNKPVSVEKVDAFVTKSHHAHANYGVMASTSGFQSGAQEVSLANNITLLHITESSSVKELPFGARWGDDVEALNFQKVELEYVDGERKLLPVESNALTYYVDKIVVESGAKRRALSQIITQQIHRFLGGTVGIFENHVIEIAQPARVIAPEDDEIPLKTLVRIHVRAGVATAKTLSGPVAFDPYLLVPDVKVRNVDTGEESTISPHTLALGLDTEFKPGAFFEQPQLAHFYYCDSIEGDSVNLLLVESFQFGKLIQAELIVPTRAAKHYVPVSDATIVARLLRRLGELRCNQHNTPH